MSEENPPNPPNAATGKELHDWEELARAAATQDESVKTFEDELQLLAFEIDGAPYAIEVERVREIVRMRPITPVPRVPDEVLGVISLRGEIIEVIDLRRRLGLEAVEPNRRTRILVAANEEQTAAILVDAVREVLRVSRDAIQPSSGSDGFVDSLCTIGDRFVSMLDLDRVLSIDA